MNVPFLDLKKQYLSLKPKIQKAVNSVINQNSFILGSEVELFEKEFSCYCKAKYCLATNSGTSSLHLALLGVGIGPGDEVILPSNTFFATAEAISYVGAKPVFIDINPKTFNLKIEEVESAVTPRTKCILPVHLYGNSAPLKEILKIAKNNNLIVIEDSCQAHGVEYRGKKLGTWGRAGCFSFYPGKILGAYGEAGAIVTDDKKLYQKMKALRNHGQKRKNEHYYIGYNYRMDGIQGAVLRIKLKELDQWIKKRREKAKIYNSFLKGLVILPSEESLERSNFQYYVIRCKKRDSLKEYLGNNNISTQIHYPNPIHLQPAFNFLGYKKGDLPISEKMSGEILSLPLYPEITRNQQNYVIRKIKEFYER